VEKLHNEDQAKEAEIGGACRMNGGEKGCVCVIGRGEWIILGWILKRWDGVVWTRLVWLRTGTSGELL
jgi:hypothetical protein